MTLLLFVYLCHCDYLNIQSEFSVFVWVSWKIYWPEFYTTVLLAWWFIIVSKFFFFFFTSSQPVVISGRKLHNSVSCIFQQKMLIAFSFLLFINCYELPKILSFRAWPIIQWQKLHNCIMQLKMLIAFSFLLFIVMNCQRFSSQIRFFLKEYISCKHSKKQSLAADYRIENLIL